MPKKRMYIGIDAGLNGAIAFINEKGECEKVLDMPIERNGKNTDVKELYAILNRADKDFDVVCCVEECRYTPKMNEGERNISVMTAFKFGRSYQSVYAVCEIINFKRTYVRPEMWKGEFFLFNQNKEASIDRAIQIFPEYSGMLKYKARNSDSIVMKDGRAEAMLIALYGKNKFAKLKSKETE